MASPDAASLYAAAGSSATLLDGIFKTEAVGQILLMVNLTILAAGTFWLMWNILAGITQSAWDGEFLGKRFHTLWMPIRNAIGIAMLVPAFGGWGAAQLILYQAAKMGAGAANIAVANGAGSFIQLKASDVQSPVLANYRPLAGQVFERLNCREGVKLRSGKAASPGTELGGTAAEFEKFYDQAGCGSVVSPPDGVSKDAHKAAMAVMEATLQPVAAALAAGVDGAGPAVPRAQVEQALRKAAESYKTAITAALNALRESKLNEVNAAAAAGDWLGFGYRNYIAIRAVAEVNASAGETGSTTGNSNQTSAGREAAAAAMPDMGDPMTATENFSASTDVQGNVGSGESLWAIIKSAPSALLKWLFGGANVRTLVGEGGDLIAALQGIGVNLIGIGELALVAGFTIFGLMGAASALSLGAALPLAMYAIGIILIIVTPIIGLGITLAAYLPLVPSIFWTLAVVGWLLTVAESLFMAPLWAFIHLETDGEGMGQKTEKGYSFIMNLILRPLVLVFTFTIASAVLNAAWAMLGGHIANTMKSVTLFSFTGVFVFIGLCFAIVTTAMAMVYKVYGTAIGLADAIPAWLGTNFHNYSSNWGENDGGAGAGGQIGQGIASRLGQARKPEIKAGADKAGTEPKAGTPGG
jgi:hypothetical protein